MGGGEGKAGNELNLHLAVDDAAKAVELIRSRGGKTSELVASDDGGKFFMVTDPDGNSFKIVQRA
jgi:predicted enzyme related to lactoylglutathione lyase